MNLLNPQRPRRVNVVMLPEYIPLCPVHGDDMVSYDRRKVVIYFKCRHDGCHCTDKVARKLFVVSQSQRRPEAG